MPFAITILMLIKYLSNAQSVPYFLSAWAV
jgi:hypothetical protein